MYRLLRWIGAFACLCATSLTAQTVALRAGHVVDPATAVATAEQTILVRDGLIQAIGPHVAVPNGVPVIDLAGATVLPGLIDSHTHLCMALRPARDGGSFLAMALNDANATRAILGVINTRAMLEAGFTTIRDAGNEGNYACTAVKQAIEEKRLPGPTMITSGRILAPFGGQLRLQPDRPALAEPEYIIADTRDEMLKAIRENAHFGAGLVKIAVDDQQYIYSTDDIIFMKHEAARMGLKVAAHVWTAPGAHNAAAAGVASLEHLWAIEDAAIDLAKRNGVVAVFTPLLDIETRILMPGDDGVHGRQIGRMKAALRSGIPIAFGSDAPLDLPGYDRGRLAMERIDMLLEAGMTPAQLLRAMTTVPAALLGMADHRGALRPGMAADIVAAQGNPLENAQVLKSLTFVMKNGVVIRQRQ